MSTYKQQIETQLNKNNWEIIVVDTTDHWWEDEFWKIKSVKHSSKMELIIIFKVDPQWEGNRKKGQGVWAWTDVHSPKGKTALCPNCGIDSVVHDEFPVEDQEFLNQMYQRWFQV